jgi:O-antigen ligase
MFFFYWMIAIMPLDQHWLWGHAIVGDFTVIKALGLLCFLIALVGLIARHSSPRFLLTSQARWFLVFVSFQCLSYVVHFGGLANPLGAYSHVFSILTLFFTVLVLVDAPEKLNWSLLVAIGACGYVSLYAIRQQQLYGAGTRPGGMFFDANEYALVVGMWLPLAFLWAFSKRPRWERIFCFGCFLLVLLGTTFAASRGGFLGLVASFGYLIWHSGLRVRYFALVGGLLVPLLLLTPSSPLRRLQDPGYGDKMAEQARLITWTAGLRMVRAHPVVGVGLENFKAVVSQYEDPNAIVISLCHNTYIEIAAELGPLALISFLGVLVAAFLSLTRVRRRFAASRLAHEAIVCLGMEAGILAFAVSAFFVSAWWEKLVWLNVFLTMCMVPLSRQAISAAERRRDRSLRGRAVECNSGSVKVGVVLGAK